MVVAATLSKDTVKEDKVMFRVQQMWTEPVILLAANNKRKYR